jgi:hypothetical protein
MDIENLYLKVDHSQVGFFLDKKKDSQKKHVYKSWGVFPIIFKDKNNTKEIFFPFVLF